jgi:hypothetical protein
MVEKGVIVQDADSGESVACRDAVQVDDGSNSRIIQLVDNSSRKNSISMASPLRTVTSSDSLDLSSISTDITDNLITIGDASSVIAALTYEDNGTDQGIYVTPIIFEESSLTVIALLEPKKFASVTEQWNDSYAEQFVLSGTTIPTIMQSWNVMGAFRVGFHVYIRNASSVSLYACVGSDGEIGISGLDPDSRVGSFGYSESTS